MNLRSKVLVAAYRLFPFSLKGDVQLDNNDPYYDISCVINFYGRINLLEGILYSLAQQDLQKKNFEVILVEDRNGSEEGRNVSEKFGEMLNIRYYPLPDNFGKMGYARNFGLSKANGRFILFLDDDTIILQNDFLSNLIEEFDSSHADAVIPRGGASLFMLQGKYGFHEPYFPANKCMAYRKETLARLAGFVSEIIGQEDVEFVVRFTAAEKIFHASEKLCYYHPPLFFNNPGKAIAVGYSFFNLRKRYPLIVWIMLLVNSSRHLILLLFPITMKWKMQGKFGLGFVLGIAYAITGRNVSYS